MPHRNVALAFVLVVGSAASGLAASSPFGGSPAPIPGTIEAENYDIGGEGVAYHDTTAGNTGGVYRVNENVDVSATGAPEPAGFHVSYTRVGEWLKYTVNAAEGIYTLNARVASVGAGGTFHVEIDGVNVTGAMTVPNTGAWQTYRTISKSGIAIAGGPHVLRLSMDTTANTSIGNVNWISFVSEATATPTTGATATFTSTPTATATPSPTPIGATATVTSTATPAPTATLSPTPGATATTAPFAVKINFQPASSPGFAGYLVDSGLVYGARSGGLSYGWNVDVSALARDRNLALSPDQRYDTFIHMQNTAAPNAAWDIAVPNDTYTVHIVSGDPGFFDSVYKISVEGVLVVSGTPTTGARWVEGTAVVAVSDGKLSVRSATGSTNNKIDYIEITGSSSASTPTATATPAVTPSATPTGTATAAATPTSSTATPTATATPLVTALISADFESDAVNTLPSGWQTFVAYIPNNSNSLSQVFVDDTRAHSGTHSLRVHGPASGPVQIVKKLPSKPVNLYMRAWVYMSRSMGNDSTDNHEHIIALKADENGSFSANTELRIGQGKGHLGYNIVPSDAISPPLSGWFSGPTTPVNTWYCVEEGILTGGAYDEADMWVDGQLVNSVTSAADWHSPVGANWADPVMGFVAFGWHSFSNHSAEIWMDDIVVSTQRVGCGN